MSQTTEDTQTDSPATPRLAASCSQHGVRLEALVELGVASSEQLAWGWDQADILAKLGKPGLGLWNEAMRESELEAEAKARIVTWKETTAPRTAGAVEQRSGADADNEMDQPLAKRAQNKIRNALEKERSLVQRHDHAAPEGPTPAVVRVVTALVELLSENWVHSAFSQQLRGSTYDIQAKFLAMLNNQLETYSEGVLRQALAAWKRWRRWAAQHLDESMVIPAKEIHLAIFLQAVADGEEDDKNRPGGPTAAEDVLRGLKFLNDKLRFELPVKDIVPAVPQGQLAVRPISQAAPLTYADISTVVYAAANSKDDITKYVARVTLVILAGGVRFRHAQRSSVAEVLPGVGLVLECYKGKTRRRGRIPPPFKWAVPQAGFIDEGFIRDINQDFTRVLPEGARFLLPALLPRNASLHNATEFAAHPMTTPSFSRVIKQLVLASPAHWPPRTGLQPSAHSPRRTLATLAECMEGRPDDRLALGSWQEDLRARDTECTASATAMPVIYTGADTKLWRQFHVKGKVIGALYSAMTSEDATAFFQEPWTGQLALRLRATYATEGYEGMNVQKHVKAQEAGRSRSRSPARDGSSPSSGAGDTHGEGGDSEKTGATGSPPSSWESQQHDSDELSTLEWVLPRCKDAHLHRVRTSVITGDGPPQPKCQNVKVIKGYGIGYNQACLKAPDAVWCKRCAHDIALLSLPGETPEDL